MPLEEPNVQSIFRTAAILALGPALAPAVRLTQPAQQAFDAYIASLEARLAKQHSRAGAYVAVGTGPSPAGAVQVEAVNGGSWAVPGGRIHHWRAAALVPGATAKGMLALLRDYDHLSEYYAPEVVSAHALAGGKSGVAMRFRKQQIVTVVLDAEFEARSGLSGAHRGYSFSRSSHIWQVDQAGSAREHRRQEGEDDGYLWRLNSYWSFEERRGGLWIECEAVSLTRDVPAALGWLVMPVVEALPRASLEFTLTATKNALAAKSTGGHGNREAWQ